MIMDISGIICFYKSYKEEILMNELLNEVKQMHSEIIEWRRHFHQNAELSFEEYKTSDFIEEKLKSFGGIEIERPTKTGVIGKIYGAGQ